jgi:hypothetical protein
MNNPNDYVGFRIANDYITDRLEYEESRRLIKQSKSKTKRPSKFYCAICRTLVSVGHMFVAFGRRLERFDMGLRESNA